MCCSSGQNTCCNSQPGQTEMFKLSACGTEFCSDRNPGTKFPITHAVE